MSLVLMRPNRAFNDPPRVEAAPMTPTAMRAAINPYSIAVAPDSQAQKRRIRVIAFPKIIGDAFQGAGPADP